MTALARAARAYPTLLRVGLAEVVAYRAEFLVWILTTNLPLIQLALWNAVAADGPVGRFGQTEFRAYFLAILFARLLTSSWVVWELAMEIRSGALAARVLRPMHPIVQLSAQHFAAIPMRILVSLPILALLALYGGSGLSALADPRRAVVFVLSLLGGWLLMFLTMVLIGALGLFIESAMGVFDLWFSIHSLLSGYLVPVELLPSWMTAAARAMPFWYILGFPVETMLGLGDTSTMLVHLAAQWTYVAVTLVAVIAVWRAGMRRFVAFGG